MSKPNRKALLANVTSCAFADSGAGAALAEAIIAAASPISFTKNDEGKRVLSAPCQKRVNEVQARFMLGFVGARLFSGMPEADAIEAAEGVVAGVAHNSKTKTLGNRLRRTKEQDTVMATARKRWSRARQETGLTTGDKREGNKNAKRTGSNKAKPKAKVDNTAKPPAIKEPAQAWEYAALQADAMFAHLCKKNAKVTPNALARLVTEFRDGVRAAMPSE